MGVNLFKIALPYKMTPIGGRIFFPLKQTVSQWDMRVQADAREK